MALKRQYVEIDALKGWAIFLVVLGHSIIVHPVDLHSDLFWGKLFTIVTSLSMSLFFLVSGYCFSFRSDYKTYITKKMKRILIPYLAFCLIEAVPKALLGNLINGSKSFSEAIKLMLFYGGYYWFLWTLLLILVVYPFFQKLFCRNAYTKTAGTSILLVLSLVRIPVDFWCLEQLSHYFIWFWLGNLAREFWDFDHRPVSKKASGLLFVLTGFVWVLLCCTPLTNTAIAFNTKLIVEGLLGIAFSLAATRFSWFNQFFAKYGKYSLQMYLLNGIFLGLSRTLICNVFHVQSGLPIVAFNMLIDFFLSYLAIRYVCEKIRPVRFLMGM